jgi:hypothetical protein
MKMKVIYILLVSLIWGQVAGAQTTGTQKTVSAGLSTELIIYALIIALVLAGITLYLALKISGNRTEDQIADLLAKIKRENKKNDSGAQPAVHGGSFAAKDEIKVLEDRLMVRINDLEKMVEKLQEKKAASVVPASPVPASGPAPQKAAAPVADTQPAVEVRKETFYLSTPNSNGTFNESSSSTTYREGASIYRFTKESFNKATFCIDDREASIKLALQYPDKNIDPVCEASNAYNPKASRIVTTSPGTAELLGENWFLKTKAKISYEG